MPRNHLSPDVLHGSCDLRQFLLVHKLNSSDLTGVPLTDPHALELLETIVSCALPDDAAVVVNNQPIQGGIGLCPTWATAVPPASSECRELVSACVLARVNRTGQRVVISFHGQAAPLSRLWQAVYVEDTRRDSTTVPSMQSCQGTTVHQSSDNCGWTGHFVGRCQPGTSVTVRPQPNAIRMIRACRGLYGCDAPSDAGQPPPAPDAREYIGSTDGAPLTFTCPNSPLGPSSYFSIMTARAGAAVAEPRPPRSRSPHPQPPDGILVTGAEYPALEQDVFTYREGGFYGNLFDVPCLPPCSGALAPPACDPFGALSSGEYACYSDIWSYGVVRLQNRLCAGPTDQCSFGNAPYPCLCASPSVNPVPNATMAAQRRCTCQSAPPESSYSGCPGAESPAPRYNPITVFLNDPCDLVDVRDEQARADCLRARRSPAPAAQACGSRCP
jgi:hypothetical protein